MWLLFRLSDYPMKRSFFLILRCALLLASQPLTGKAQQLRPEWEGRAYGFLGDYFREDAATKPYRLDVALLPVVSPYAAHFAISQALSAEYLTQQQFATTVKVDTLLAEADFAAMREQLAAWQVVPQWNAARLRAQQVHVLRHHKRRAAPPLFPAFTTYRVFPPLFSRNGRLAIFYVENYCGLDCAGGDIHLLRQRANGSWMQVLGCPVFVS
jgi:hypothetical protein